MDFYSLVDISERSLEIVNPFSESKLLAVGSSLELKPGDHVLDMGCGYGEALRLWGERYGIAGVGVDNRPNAVTRARSKMEREGLAGCVHIVESAASDLHVEGAFDAAVCLGASFAFGGFGPTIRALARHAPSGRIAVGEVYWEHAHVPDSVRAHEPDLCTEAELHEQALDEGFVFHTIHRAGRAEWDGYETANWRGLLHWLEENPDHPEREAVHEHLLASQREYFGWGREWFGWAVFVLRPLPALR